MNFLEYFLRKCCTAFPNRKLVWKDTTKWQASSLSFNPKMLLWNTAFENRLYLELCVINRLCCVYVEVGIISFNSNINTPWVETRYKMGNVYYVLISFPPFHQHRSFKIFIWCLSLNVVIYLLITLYIFLFNIYAF